MSIKKSSRLKRSRKFRARQELSSRPCLTVHRTSKHIYAQLLEKNNGDTVVIASSSTLHKDIREKISGNKTEQAIIIGREIARQAIKANITSISFDRSGNKFHGRLKALANSAREAGLNF